MRKKALSHEEREILVVNWFAIRIQNDNESYASLYEIARGLGMSPSSHLRNIVHGMVDKGILDSKLMQRSGRWDGRGYMLVRGSYQRIPKQQRTIAVKSKNGIERLEMF